MESDGHRRICAATDDHRNRAGSELTPAHSKHDLGFICANIFVNLYF